MKKIFLTLCITTLLTCNSFAEIPNCPGSPYKETSGKIIAKGFGKTEKSALKEAITELNLSINGSKIDSQFLQISTNTSQKVFSASQVTSLSNQTLLIDDKQVLPCSIGYVSYILYDERSLARKINHLLSKAKYYLNGESYLITSKLLKQYHHPQSSIQLTVSLISTPNGDFLLTLGSNEIKIKKNKIEKLINLTTQNIKSNTEIALSSNKVSAGQTFSIEVSSPTPQFLFFCNEEGDCQTISRTKAGKQKIQLTSSSVQNSKLLNAYVFSINANSRYLPSLFKSITQQQGETYLQLINLLQEHPKQTQVIQFLYSI
jgi:hypothetical protein